MCHTYCNVSRFLVATMAIYLPPGRVQVASSPRDDYTREPLAISYSAASLSGTGFPRKPIGLKRAVLQRAIWREESTSVLKPFVPYLLSCCSWRRRRLHINIHVAGSQWWWAGLYLTEALISTLLLMLRKSISISPTTTALSSRESIALLVVPLAGA